MLAIFKALCKWQRGAIIRLKWPSRKSGINLPSFPKKSGNGGGGLRKEGG